jgi:hypothetical protein
VKHPSACLVRKEEFALSSAWACARKSLIFLEHAHALGRV